MVQMRKLPDAEFDVMKAIWQLEAPVTAGMILERLAEETHKEWKPQTLHTLLGRLADRGFLSFEKKRKEKLFYPLVAREDYLRFETNSFMKQYHEGSLVNMVAAAFQGESLSEADIEDLVQWANAHREDHV